MLATGRRLTLLLVEPCGRLLGLTPPVDVEVPWWPETESLAARVVEVLGLQVVVLRLLRAAGGPRAGAGGAVTYLAELRDGSPSWLAPWKGPDPLAPEPLRMPWATPGGPAEQLSWAQEALGTTSAPPVQVKTWNLSSIWRLPGVGWLKGVPPFFAHEAAVMRLVATLRPGIAPDVLAAAPGRAVLADAPGVDLFDAPLETLLRMVDALVDVQAAAVPHVGDLLRLGLPDWRADRFAAAARDLVERVGAQLDEAAALAVRALVEDLPDRFGALAATGIPETLVHGDFHPGNVRGTSSGPLRVIDWGDTGIGCPLLDEITFLSRIRPADRAAVAARWADAWRRAAPGCAPEQAAELVAPVAALRQALVYQGFLDRIEPDERVYHARDPAAWLSRAGAWSTGQPWP